MNKPRFLLLLLGAALAQSGQAQLPSPDRLTALLGHSDAKSYESSLVTLPDGTSWIKLEVDVEGVFPGTVDETLAVLRDYERGPQIFSRVASVKVRSRNEAFAITEQKNVVRALGLSYESTIVFKTQQQRISADEALSTFVMIDSDGTTKSVNGGWRLKAVTVKGQGAVYLEYYNSMLVAPRFPLQLQIMKAFGQGDYEKVVRELGAAVQAHRAQSGPGSGQSHSQLTAKVRETTI